MYASQLELKARIRYNKNLSYASVSYLQIICFTEFIFFFLFSLILEQNIRNHFTFYFVVLHETLSFLSPSTWLFHPFSFFVAVFFPIPFAVISSSPQPLGVSDLVSVQSFLSDGVLKPYYGFQRPSQISITIHFIEALDEIPVVKS